MKLNADFFLMLILYKLFYALFAPYNKNGEKISLSASKYILEFYIYYFRYMINLNFTFL
jgi:hypothetical protein